MGKRAASPGAREERLLQANRELKKQLAERIAELTRANEDLAAFAYSVSHDLRAPLRAIDGFSRIVLEDFGPQVPAEAHRYLGLVRDSAQHMGQMIESLLVISRLSRQPLMATRVDVTAMVREVLAELQKALAELPDEIQSRRRVELAIGDLPACEADPALLRQVYVNLLANAFKFTRCRDTATIEVGCQQGEGRVVYFVRDNGVGFDMRYASKLFGVFQRLHRAEDYDGAGVGLAVVQRIVRRHGGQVWAEAQPDQGASFFFTLGSASQLLGEREGVGESAA